MIISKPHGVIYVAIPKTASQSLSLMLEQALKQDDVPYPAESMHEWHATLEEAKEVTDLPLAHYWSFAFVRNPFDRFISYAAGHVEGFNLDPGTALAAALEEAKSGTNRMLLPQTQFLDGVKTLYRFEHMAEAIEDITARLGVELGTLPKINTSERGGYAGYYDDELRLAVADLYKRDLRDLDYRF